jgi:hypothetical protein
MQWDRYVIRTAQADIVVRDVEAASEEIKRITADAKGFVAQSNLRHENDHVVADISIQVPAASFDDVLGQLKGLAVTVDSVRISSQDVTDEYVDNEARLRNLQASEASTLRLMEQTDKMEDVLAIQRELTNIRGQIEQIQGRQNYLKRRVDMSTISIHLSTESATTLASLRSGRQPLRTAGTAWEASLTFISFGVDLLVATVVFLWWFILLVAIAVVIWRLRRRRQRRPPTAAIES